MTTTVTLPQSKMHHHRSTYAALLMATLVAVVVALGITALARLASTDTSAGVTPVAVTVPNAAFAPGGSVYQEQVPALAATLTIAQAFGPGSALYAEQVPAEAASMIYSTDAYQGTGSTATRAYDPSDPIYQHQVPAVPKAYDANDPIYQHQVPPA